MGNLGKVFFAVGIMGAVLCSCERDALRNVGSYSYKTSGVVQVLDGADEQLCDLVVEKGQMEVVKNSDGNLSIIKNVMGEGVYEMQAVAEGDSITIAAHSRKIKYHKGGVTREAMVEVAGGGRFYERGKLVIREEFRGDELDASIEIVGEDVLTFAKMNNE